MIHDDNPFAPPEAVDDPAEIAWPDGTGVYRDGDHLVVGRAAELPPICVRTGKPADTLCQVELVCLGGTDHTIQANYQSVWGGTRFEIIVPVTQQWLSRQRRFTKLAALAQIAGAGAIGLALALIFSSSLMNNYWFSVSSYAMMLGGILCFIVGSCVHDIMKPLQHVTMVSKGYIWLLGANRRCLEQLPVWPMRRSSVWQRFLGR